MQTFSTRDPLSGKNEAISRLGGLNSLYIRHVERFQSRYHDSSAVLMQLLNQKDYEGARIMIHSLKGLSATLGMNDLYSISSDVENAILEGRYDDLPPLLSSYEKSLDLVVQSRADQSSSSEGTGFSGFK